MIDQKHMDIIKSYASTITHQLKSDGLWVEREDMEGEFSVCYAKAKALYVEGTSAKFETYFIAAILNRTKDIKHKMMSEVRGTSWRHDSKKESEPIPDTAKTREAIDTVLHRLTAKEQIMLAGLIESDATAECPEAWGRSVTRVDVRRLHASVADAHGISRSEFRHRVGKIKSRVHKAL